MSTTTGQAADELAAVAATLDTPALCNALRYLDGQPDLTPGQQLARGVLITVICERHPEADRAFDEWAAGTEPGGAVDAITMAAFAAAGED